MVKNLLLAVALCLLIGCHEQPRINVACASLNKSDIEAAIPGVPFPEEEASMTDDDYDHLISSCGFQTVSGNRWVIVTIEIDDGEKQPRNIQQLRKERESDRDIDIHELKGLGDEALWYVFPAGFDHSKGVNLAVVRGSNQYAHFSLVGIPDDEAEPVLTKFAGLALPVAQLDSPRLPLRLPASALKFSASRKEDLGLRRLV